MKEQLQRQASLAALIKRFWSDDEGQDLVEYALLCTVVSLAGVLGVQALIAAVANVFTIISNQLR